MKNNFKYAFTLAEVLITLGIIGVVAAMTMPSLMANQRKKVAETRLAKFYTNINQAITLSEVDHGDKKSWEVMGSGYETDEDGNPDKTKSKVLPWFNEYLAKYLITTEVKLTTAEEGKVMAYFTDGSLALFSNASIIFYPQAKDYSEKDNGSGGTTRNNALAGTKYFTFAFWPADKSNIYHYNQGVEPYKRTWDGTEEMLRNSSAYGCKKDVSNERAYCTALIQINGWKIPKDYPIGF